MTRADRILDLACLAAAIITLALSVAIATLSLAPVHRHVTLTPGGKIGLRAAVAQARICEAAR